MFPNTYFPTSYFTSGYLTILAVIVVTGGGFGGTNRYWIEKAKEDREFSEKEEEALLYLARLDDKEVLDMIMTMFKMGIFNG